MARVVIQNLSKNFRGPTGVPVPAVRDANLAIEDKELLVLVGPSGSGKTTILRLVAGLEEISRGTISIDGEVVNDLPPQDRDIAMVFQNYALYPHLTVYDNMALGLKLRKIPHPVIQERIREAASVLGLAHCLDRRPNALSGGERQRVALGRAIVRQPKLFLLDEPLANLDAPLRVQMRAEIVRLHKRLGATMLYVTHDQLEAMTLGHRVVVMKEGLIQQVDSPLRLYHAPANLFVAGFFGTPPMNFFYGTLLQRNSTLVFVEQNSTGSPRSFAAPVAPHHQSALRGYLGQNVILGLRPENLRFQGEARLQGDVNPLSSHDPSISAAVELVEPIGAETYLHLTTGNHSFIARIFSDIYVAPAESISLSFNPSDALYFDPGTHQAIASPKS